MADFFPLSYQGSAMEKKTILVVDDDEAIRLLCHEVLSDDGYHVVQARDCEEAIKKIEQTNPDIVILDIPMSRTDCMEALSKILRKNRQIRIILYTACPVYQRDSIAGLADAYVLKSSDLSELEEKTMELLSATSTWKDEQI